MVVAVARLKITLDDVAPQVMRRIEVPLALRLDRLHTVLLAALGWTDSHLWELRFRSVGFGIPNDFGGHDPFDARKATLRSALDDTGVKSFKYLYDFGDHWQHSVKVEAITPARAGLGYPFLIAATGRCPPQDVGGPPGYAVFLEAIADPAHEQHGELLAWAGDSFDPGTVDISTIDQALDARVRRWSRKKA